MNSAPAAIPNPFIGRKPEQEELTHARDSGRPELIAIYGRRRIGKTRLVRHFFGTQLCFEMSGVRAASRALQLQNFAYALQAVTPYKHEVPRTWPEAFQVLIRYLEAPLARGRKVVFLDELPWLASRRSGFLPAFEHFWNSWGTRQNNLVVVICGSAASWMISKLVRQTGGLHNRVTRTMALQPFNLHETREFLRSRGIQLDQRQILELYMAVGGVPYYLDYLRKGRSAAQNIEAMFFAANAPLQNEFNNLYAALFEHHERHVSVIRALARKQSGVTRQDLVKSSKLPSGGALTTILMELEVSGFVCRMHPFGRTAREPLYRVVDELTLFHLRWVDIKRTRLEGAGHWAQIHSTPAWYAWSGYSFENLCLKHVAQIKRGLGIGGVQTAVSSWRHVATKAGESGAQIDLLIDRRDGVINVCEMKFAADEFVIDKKYARELRTKLDVFRRVSATRKSALLTMVTALGVKPNEAAAELVQCKVTASELFESDPAVARF